MRRTRSNLQVQNVHPYENQHTTECDLQVEKINNDIIGRGVFAKKAIPEGNFITEYTGEKITYEEALEREKVYEAVPGTGSSLFFYSEKENVRIKPPMATQLED
ncbi:hypothetical protein AC249_AIPGENE6663 [Exaiptasia diaphana]|nr:hypothetical protein AC249_AIPGENE6663 [Exaiptasia diaphana]